MKTKILSFIVCSLTLLTSCSDWLDIKPKMNVEEDELFKREQGFKEALTGIYIQMSNPGSYGRELTYGFLDVLAQRYSVNAEDAQDYTLKEWYEFPSQKTESYTVSFWSNHYNMIANLNNLLANIDKKRDVFTTDGYYEIIKGEALGLRSFLYFDLFRMYGPIYKNNPAAPSIPYRTQFDRATAKAIPAKDLLDSLATCLTTAEELLKDDPMNISFPVSDYGGNGFLDSRMKRMNKYAVKAELARVYLYKQDKVNAEKYANEVIQALTPGKKKVFNLVSDNATDRICSTELIFSLSMDESNFAKQVTDDFIIAMWGLYYINDRNRLNELFETAKDGSNDMRVKEGQGFAVSATGAYTLKFSQSQLFSPVISNTMPLIRLPEMYYIQAECTSDLTESAKILSVVRSARGVDNLLPFKNEQEKLEGIEKEYRKEFYGEGQLWYFYKRNAYTKFQFCPLAVMTEKNYCFSIPDDELSLGNIY